MKILLVDDDENILHGYHRSLHRTFQMEVAFGGPQAIQAMENHGPFAVIISDMRMPGMSGLELLKEAQRLAPDTTRIMLTGDADQKTAMDAVNQGRVFRFLTKPCPNEVMALTIHAGIRQHQLVVAEKELLNQTLMGSLQVLMDLLSSLDPEAFGRGELLRERALVLARALAFQEEWDLEIASILLPLGRIALPPELQARLRAAAPLEVREKALIERIPETGSKLLQNIPRLEQVARIIAYHRQGFDGSGFPGDGTRGQDLPMGARILKALTDFTDLERQRRSRAVALEELSLHASQYDPKVLEALFAHFPVACVASAPPERECVVAELTEGMVLARSVRISNGRPVLLAGLKLGPAHLALLRGVGELLDLQEPIRVLNP
jgi:response regulator RpfG family c-di-GMP phosphodiesterase